MMEAKAVRKHCGRVTAGEREFMGAAHAQVSVSFRNSATIGCVMQDGFVKAMRNLIRRKETAKYSCGRKCAHCTFSRSGIAHSKMDCETPNAHF
jgi:hypothetical protein